MNLKCQLTDNPCDNEAMWIMITGCTEGHLEETPLCTTHLNHWKDCAEHKNLSILYCMCHEKVIEYDYTPISKVTQQWIYEYTSKLTDELPLSNIVAPHPTGNPSHPTLLRTMAGNRESEKHQHPRTLAERHPSDKQTMGRTLQTTRDVTVKPRFDSHR